MRLLSNYTARTLILDPRDAEIFLKTGFFWLVLANSCDRDMYRVNCEHPGSCQAPPETPPHSGLQDRATASSDVHDLALPSGGPLSKNSPGSREEKASEAEKI